MKNKHLGFDWDASVTEAIELEPEDFDRAGEMSDRAKGEANQWQTYLNTLALFGFEKWLGHRVPDLPIKRENRSIGQLPLTQPVDAVCHLKVGQLTLCLIAAQQFLDRVVPIPKAAIDWPDRLAHCYVAIEVLEEQQQAIVRGFLRYDRLAEYQQSTQLCLDRSNCYPFPLAEFDPQLHRLLLNLRFLTPTAIPLSATQSKPEAIQQPVQLSRWWDNLFEVGWQTVESLLSSEGENLAWSLRGASPLNRESGVKRGKLVDLGMELDDRLLTLLVALTPEEDEKVGIRIQIHPAGEQRYLPPNLQLVMLSQAGETLQEVRSRPQDRCIQLKWFKTKPGKGFGVRVALGDRHVTEEFVV